MPRGRAARDRAKRRADRAEHGRARRPSWQTERASAFASADNLAEPPAHMLHVIPVAPGRPSDDPIFALNREATQRRSAASRSSTRRSARSSTTTASSRSCRRPRAPCTRCPPSEWAAYAPIAGTPGVPEGGHRRPPRAASRSLRASRRRRRRRRAARARCATPSRTSSSRGSRSSRRASYWGPYQTLSDEADRKVATFAMFDKRRRSSTSPRSTARSPRSSRRRGARSSS